MQEKKWKKEKWILAIDFRGTVEAPSPIIQKGGVWFMFLYRITKTNPAADPCFFSYSMFISSLVALHLFDEMPHQTDSSNPLQ
jgi:hypothetical protein